MSIAFWTLFGGTYGMMSLVPLLMMAVILFGAGDARDLALASQLALIMFPLSVACWAHIGICWQGWMGRQSASPRLIQMRAYSARSLVGSAALGTGLEALKRDEGDLLLAALVIGALYLRGEVLAWRNRRSN
jgi:hypothetical protein